MMKSGIQVLNYYGRILVDFMIAKQESVSSFLKWSVIKMTGDFKTNPVSVKNKSL